MAKGNGGGSNWLINCPSSVKPFDVDGLAGHPVSDLPHADGSSQRVSKPAQCRAEPRCCF